MGHRILDHLLCTAANLLVILALATGFLSSPLDAQTAPKKQSIFDDDSPLTTPSTTRPGPTTASTTPGPLPPQPTIIIGPPVLAPPTPGAASGLLATLHDGDTTDAKPREYHLTPNLGISFVYPLTPNGYVPMAFSWRGMINVPAGGVQGVFRIKSTGESELMIDGKTVTTDHPGNPAASFETPQNLAEGAHAINASIYHLHGTGERQRMEFLFLPSGGVERAVPNAWCWHLRADEPADLIAVQPVAATRLARELLGGPFVKAGTPRPEDPSTQLTDILPGIVKVMYTSRDDFSRPWMFTATDTVRFNMSVGQSARDPLRLSPMNANRWSGLLKIDAEGKYRFDLPTLGVRISVDGRIVTTGGASNDAGTHQAVSLAPGNHDFQVELSQLQLRGGSYDISLLWEVNGKPYEPIPATAFFHTRGQEPYDTLAPNSAPPGPPVPVAVAPPSEPAKPKVRAPVPSEVLQAAAKKKIRAQFATFYSNSSAIVRASLLEKLLAEADSASDAAEKYTALREAGEVAAGMGDLKTISRCTSGIAGAFQVDEVTVRIALLTAAGSAPGKTAASARNLAEADLNLASDAVQTENYDVAVKALSLAQSGLNTAADEALTARHHDLEKQVREAKTEYLKVAPITKKLAETPDDPDLNLKAGRFYCLTAGNWKRGLPMLEKGSDVTLKVLAQTEATKPTASDAQLQLADGWWDHASAEKNGSAAARCKQRAGRWYRRAVESSVGPAPERAMTRFLSTATTVNLLTKINPARDVLSGTWNVGPGGVSSVRSMKSQLQFSYKPPEEYDYVVQFTINSLFGGVVQLIPVKDSTLVWHINNGFCTFEQSLMNSAPPPTTPVFLQVGRSYTSTIQVRRKGLRGIVNGVVYCDWKTDVSEVSGSDTSFWKSKDPRLLGFGTPNSEITIQSARVIALGADPD